MRRVSIQGAGISGLTAAINLAKMGYEVEVHEKLSDVGQKHRLNFEGLENWTSDIMSMLKKINIDTNFRKKGLREVTWYSPSFNKVVMKAKKPFFYLVERGGRESIEYSLKRQALKLGVDIKYGSDKKSEIVSVGAKRPMAMAFGSFFEDVKHKDCVIGVLSNRMSPNGYFYLLVWKNRATVCTTSTSIDSFRKLSELHLKNLQSDICCNILGKSIKKNDFSGFANFSIPKTAVVNDIILTGEAAGFQDHLLGFGMKYAFLSGYFAAMSIEHKEIYDKLWKRSFGREMKKTTLIRQLVGDNEEHYEKIIRNLGKEKNYLQKLRNAYCEYNWKHELLYNAFRVLSKFK